MIKTQIQLPDEMYRAAKELAASREWSLAEIFRRGLEYVLRTCPLPNRKKEDWKLPGPFNLGMKSDFFDNPDWRYETNLTSGAQQIVAEKKATYGKREK